MKLAINGGTPVRQGLLPAQITIQDLPNQIQNLINEEGNFNIDSGEVKAVLEVLRTKALSGFRGNSSSAFRGGEKIKELESAFLNKFNRNTSWQATSVNSCTSALQLACGAAGIQPGDEVIVTPWSMSCSASAPLIWGAVPVFADIERDYFCLDPKSIEEKITSKTKAIIVVDLFGQPFHPAILAIAEEHNLVIVEDAAQALGSGWMSDKDNVFPAGFIGDIGCFSFTQGKHLTAGEGGMLTSFNPVYTSRLQLLRNHAEAVISDMDSSMYHHQPNMVGYNMRMTEIQAAILIEQLKKMEMIIHNRQENAFYFANKLNEIPAITPAPIRKSCTHSFYVQAFFWDKMKADGIHRNDFIRAVKAELQPQEGRVDLGVPIGFGYVKPLYAAPLYQMRMHWAIKNTDYSRTFCPTAERLWQDEVFLWTLTGLALNDQDRKDISDAFFKVWENKEELI